MVFANTLRRGAGWPVRIDVQSPAQHFEHEGGTKLESIVLVVPIADDARFSFDSVEKVDGFKP